MRACILGVEHTTWLTCPKASRKAFSTRVNLQSPPGSPCSLKRPASYPQARDLMEGPTPCRNRHVHVSHLLPVTGKEPRRRAAAASMMGHSATYVVRRQVRTLHVVSQHATPCRAGSCQDAHVTLRRATPRHDSACYATSCHVMSDRLVRLMHACIHRWPDEGMAT